MPFIGCIYRLHLSDQCCTFRSVLVKKNGKRDDLRAVAIQTLQPSKSIIRMQIKPRKAYRIACSATNVSISSHWWPAVQLGDRFIQWRGSCSTKTRGIGQEETPIPINTHGCRGSPPRQNRYDRNVGYTYNMHKCVENKNSTDSCALQQRLHNAPLSHYAL